MTETSARPLRTPAEAAQRLNVTPEQVIGFAHDGELHYVNVGRGLKRPRYRFTDADIDELIEKRKQRGAICRSTERRSRAHTSGTTSSSVVEGFAARRERQISAKRKR
jgi:excisionase family DNA binding protein